MEKKLHKKFALNDEKSHKPDKYIHIRLSLIPKKFTNTGVAWFMHYALASLELLLKQPMNDEGKDAVYT